MDEPTLKTKTLSLNTGEYTMVEGFVSIAETKKTHLVLKKPIRQDPEQQLLPFEEPHLNEDNAKKILAALEVTTLEDGTQYVRENTDPAMVEALIEKTEQILDDKEG